MRSVAELTEVVFGKAMTMGEAFASLESDGFALVDPEPVNASVLRVSSVGYERYRESADFARRLTEAGIERLVDVRELPISRRRGYAKRALAAAMATEGIEYVHVRALGNPKPFRDLYKAGRAAEGRAHYERFLLAERRDALDELVEMLQEKPCALMCVEHDPATCHRTVITDALRDVLELDFELVHLT